MLEGSAVAHGRNLPLLPVLQVFRAYYGIDERDDDRTVRERIAGRLLLLDEGFREVLPVMFEFFGVPDPERPVPHMEPEAKQRVLFGVLRKIVQGADPRAGAQNFVTLIEDLHWMDAASEAFLEQWVDALAGGRGLLILNFRPEYRAEWMQKSYYRQIPLAPLGPAAVAELLADLLGRDPSLAGLADGDPRAHGREPLLHRGGGAGADRVGPALGRARRLPAGRGARRARGPLARAGRARRAHRPAPRAREAAAPDRRRDRQGVQRARARARGRSFPRRARAMRSRALRRAEFVYEASLYPVAEYAFKHPLTQEVALGSQLRERRARTHAAVARAIEELHADKLDEHAALLAQHWDEAGEPIAAARWYERAALRIGQSDVKAAARHWRRVRELARERAEDAEAAGLATRACTWVLSAGWRLGISPEEVEATAAEARSWLAQCSDVEASIRLEGALCSFHNTRGEMEPSLACAFAAERVAEASGDPRLRAMARYGPLYPWLNTGPVDLARGRADELVAYARAHGDLPAPFGGEDLLALVMGFQALLEAQHGSVARAREILSEAQQVARERGLVESEGWTTMFVGWNEWIDGDTERAIPYCRRALELAERIGSPFSIAWGLGSLAQVLAHAGSGEALEVAERSVALCRERGTSLEGEGQHLAALAEACIVAGDLARARRVAEEAIEVGRRRGIRRYEIDAWLALSRAERAAGSPGSLRRAHEALAEVDALAEATRAPNWRFVAEFERAGIASTAGDAAARERHLRAALAGFEKIEAEYRVRQIRALLSAPS